MEDILIIIRNSIKQIAEILRNNNSLILGKITKNINDTGDEVKNFDLQSNNILLENLKKCKSIKRIFSEEIEEPIMVNPKGRYMVTFDPLDGSGNLDVNISSGTIFGIFIDDDDSIIKAKNVVAAGYGLYSGATQYLEATDKINIYQLIEDNWQLIKHNHFIPTSGKVYSFNHCNFDYIHSKLTTLLNLAKENRYSCRWAGCMVTDVHRIILKGGWWCYPSTKKNNNGKIRLLYEAIPFSYIFKLGKGCNSNFKNNLLESEINLQQDSGHKKTAIILGSDNIKNLI